MNKALTSWKTTAAGAVAALGGFLVLFDDPRIHQLGIFLGLAGAALVGVCARDHNVSSETAGAK